MRKSNSGNGIGLFTILFIVFLVLKLTSVINWSWWWITAPLWGPVVLIIIIIILCLMFKIPLDD